MLEVFNFNKRNLSFRICSRELSHRESWVLVQLDLKRCPWISSDVRVSPKMMFLMNLKNNDA